MKSHHHHLSAAVALLMLICASRADAGSIVGDPLSLDITLKQGGTTIIPSTHITLGPGGMLEDLKATFMDGDPESFVGVGSLPLGGGSSPIILKVVTEDDPTFKLLHMYIDVPISLADINTAGPFSLFNTADPAPIEVSVTNVMFPGGAAVIPQLFNTNSFFTSFMRDQGGHFYESPQTNAYNSYGHGVNDIQVPATAYLDGNPLQYSFSATPGAISSWAWSDIVNPGPVGSTIHNGIAGGLPSTGNGYVFELGLDVAFTLVPEPATIVMLVPLFIISRRRRSNV